MATVTNVARVRNQPQRFGQLNMRVVDITLGTYATGGEALTLAQLGFGVGVYGMVVVGRTAGVTTTSATTFWPDVSSETAPKIVAFAAGSQVANSTDLSAITIRCLVWGL